MVGHQSSKYFTQLSSSTGVISSTSQILVQGTYTTVLVCVSDIFIVNYLSESDVDASGRALMKQS